MTYEQSLTELNNAVLRTCRLSTSRQNAPTEILENIAAEVQCIIDTGVGREEDALRKMSPVGRALMQSVGEGPY